ncbi:MAG: hypothetical protein KAW09_12000, partial [Thermoplasmata archaeon]|nr:hypothetical protein [Thermoplasmata archaeon]
FATSTARDRSSLALLTFPRFLMTFTSIWILVPLGIVIVIGNLGNVNKAKEERSLAVDVANPSETED